jgi:hypothetical protein
MQSALHDAPKAPIKGHTSVLVGFRRPAESRIVDHQWESVEKLMERYNSPAQKDLIAIQD